MHRNVAKRYPLSCLLSVCFISSTATLTRTFATNGSPPSPMAMLLSSLPAGWNDVDVGKTGIPGTATYFGDSFTVSGSGQGIWGTSDAFNYAYQPDPGDVDIEVHVTANKTTTSAKAGIMIRSDLSARASYVSMLFVPGSGPVLQFRRFNGGKTKAWSFGGPSDSSWLKLSRSGNAFSGYASSDGVNWISLGPIYVDLGSAASVGLAVGSGTDSALYQATFDSVSYDSAAIGLSSVTVSSASVIGGSSLQGTVSMNAPAPPQGATVSLVSGNPSLVAVPSSVTVFGGSTSTTFSITTSPVQTSTSTNIVASYGATSTSAVVTLMPVTVVTSLSSITINPTSVVGGSPSQGTVTLSGAAPSGGAFISLSSSSISATSVPASVFVGAGLTSATFTVTTSTVTSSTNVTITARYSSVIQTAALTVLPAVALSGVSVNPTSVTGGGTSQGTVTLSSAAPPGGAVVSLSSSNTSAAAVSATVTVQSGATSATFTVTTRVVSSATNLSITASYNGVNRTATLSVQPVLALVALSASPASVTGGTFCQATVTLSQAAPSSGTVVSLTSSNTQAAAVPLTTTVQAGATTASFTVTTSPVSAATTVTLTASYNLINKTATLSVQPVTVSLSAVSLNPTSVTGGSSSHGAITLTGAAPSGGAIVSLSSSNASAGSVPAGVTLQAGATTASFTVNTSSVSTATNVTITATYGSARLAATLSISPQQISGAALYVATSGSDSNPGTLAAPFLTINKGISALGGGGTLVIMGGTYNETIGVTRAVPSGSSFNTATTIVANAGDTVILLPAAAPNAVVRLGSGEQYVILKNLIIDGTNSRTSSAAKITDGSNHIRFDGCEIRNAPQGMGVLITEGSSSPDVVAFNEIVNCNIHNNGGLGDGGSGPPHGLYISTKNNLISNCDVHDNPRGYGIHLFGGDPSSNTISSCFIHNNLDGMIVDGDNNLIYDNVFYGQGIDIRVSATTHLVSNNKILNNTFYGSDAAIFVSNDVVGGPFAQNTIIQNNIVWDYRSRDQIKIWQSADSTTCTYNITHDPVHNMGTSTTLSNNLTADPLFVSITANDYHVAAASPAIGSGVAQTAFSTDKDGTARSQGAGWDRGAYVYSSR